MSMCFLRLTSFSTSRYKLRASGENGKCQFKYDSNNETELFFVNEAGEFNIKKWMQGTDDQNLLQPSGRRDPVPAESRGL